MPIFSLGLLHKFQNYTLLNSIVQTPNITSSELIHTVKA